jgi:type I restriction enzyme R subunit
MSNFDFLAQPFSTIYEPVARAEEYVHSDPRASLFYSRRAVEQWVDWLYTYEKRLYRPPDDGQLFVLLGRTDFQRIVPPQILDKAHFIRKASNQAIHRRRTIPQRDSLAVLKELFQLCRWHARHYSRDLEVPDNFNLDAIPPVPSEVAALTLQELREHEATLQQQDQQLREALATNASYHEQLAALQAEITAIRQAAEREPDTLDYSEAETRTAIIDVNLREAGWNPDAQDVREYPVTGMPDTASGEGFVDYVLWGDDGLPLAVVEAKRTTVNAPKGRQQAKLYADRLEEQTGQRPIIFYSNGYDIYLWDDSPASGYPPRQVQGFYTQDSLQRLIQRRTLATNPTNANINQDISGRYYQLTAINRTVERFASKQRRALLVMATGTGKTRTTIGLVDLLMRTNQVKRVLFLADREALVKQAAKAFQRHLPAADPVNLLELPTAEKHRARTARIIVSTYHTIINRIDSLMPDGTREWAVGHFDLIVIDEAHRSVFRKFRSIFDYFDSHLLGLTATPSTAIDRNTYELFNLEVGVPTYSYGLQEAVEDSFLVPPVVLDVPSFIMRQGLRYDELSEEERALWDEIDWGTEEPPDVVAAGEINKVLFNKDTVDKVLETLMTQGLHVAGGDRLGKTIIFARNQAHAEFIEARFNHHYPHLAGRFARVISYKEPRSQSLIEEFSEPDRDPHIAISVDMLDTGIDIPEVVNLVFFKPVYSRTKFEQMIGRGTRLREDLFGPGHDKEEFYIFDFCQNFEYFNSNPERQEAAAQEPLRARLFKRRLDLLQELQEKGKEQLADSIRDTLHQEVSEMPLDNFLVRSKREHVERLRERERWENLDASDLAEIGQHLADLPTSASEDIPEETKRFDLLMLQLQLALLQAVSTFESLQNRVISIASNLETKPSIPLIAAQMDLLQAIQAQGWWQDVTVEMLEDARIRLRRLAPLVDKSEKRIVYTDFKDHFGETREVRLREFAVGVDRRRYREKVERFIHESENQPVVQKIKLAIPLTPDDLDALEDYFYSADETGHREQFQAVYVSDENLGSFIRRIVGLDRAAAKEKFAAYLDEKLFSADQISFINHIINYLTHNGVLDPPKLYEPPFTDLHYKGPDGLFEDDQVDDLIHIIREVNQVTTYGATL